MTILIMTSNVCIINNENINININNNINEKQ